MRTLLVLLILCVPASAECLIPGQGDFRLVDDYGNLTGSFVVSVDGIPSATLGIEAISPIVSIGEWYGCYDHSTGLLNAGLSQPTSPRLDDTSSAIVGSTNVSLWFELFSLGGNTSTPLENITATTATAPGMLFVDGVLGGIWTIGSESGTFRAPITVDSRSLSLTYDAGQISTLVPSIDTYLAPHQVASAIVDGHTITISTVPEPSSALMLSVLVLLYSATTRARILLSK